MKLSPIFDERMVSSWFNRVSYSSLTGAYSPLTASSPLTGASSLLAGVPKMPFDPLF